MSGQIKNVSGVPASLKLEHMFFFQNRIFPGRGLSEVRLAW